MAKNLVIVESPAKAKTIEGFLGKDFQVKSSYGHVRDLAKKGLAIDVENNFEPQYEVMPDKKDVIAELKKLAKGAEMVWLATDEDREGEAISWHLFETLKLSDSKTKRIVFHEITKPAILRAIEQPRNIDKNLVDAQQARRILDRLVGFEISPVLWKKVKPSLSAGRVQSVAVRLIVERERAIMDFKSTSAFKVTANFEVGGHSVLKAEHPKRFSTEQLAEEFLKECVNADFIIEKLETRPAKKSPSAPFTTSTLQQEASRKLGFSVAQTMVVAQKLYESGKITYMRTDSVNLSDTAISAAKEEIISSYGKEYVQIRQYKTKAKGAQEAHEAIRPTYMNNHSVKGDSSEQRLYEMIWKRTISSQMSDAQLEKTTATINISTNQEKLIAEGEVLKFDGFLKVYFESTDEEEEEAQSGMLPPLKTGEKLNLKQITAIQRFTHHPARYTEASLVKKLEELGIGRPSTYAPTISTVQKRGYVIKEEREGVERSYRSLTLSSNNIKKETLTEITGAEKNKLFPTDIGMVVTDFLVEHFKNILDYNFTAKVEKEFDEIAEGQIEWNKMIDSFYKNFHKAVEVTLETSERASGERKLGIDPVSGKPVYARIGRFGPIVQLGESIEGEEKPKYAGLRPNQRLEQISLEDALELFKLPRQIGQFEDNEMTVSIGRFGPYIKHKSAFYSLKKEDDPYSIEQDRAIELIEAKRKADKEKVIKTFDANKEVQILNGRWGPYISIGKNNFKIPKEKEPTSLTLEECLKIAAEAPAPKFKGKAKAAAKTKVPVKAKPKAKASVAKIK
ncbi:MAG: type I DNA topoisomerase [Bacteroidetes bacterium]|nr:type I DNA topoisomerase [Bacteroidota bacterium]HET6243248.1 type I DNA topoisomerase [Bacteroidia bacterium]